MSVKHYKKDDLVVVWEPEKCIHSANCVKGLPKVFNPKRKPWIETEHAEKENIIKTIDTCPSGALSYSLNKNINMADSNTNDTTKKSLKIKVMSSGPLIISEDCIVEYNNTTIKKEGVTALCRCGQSSNKPFCDGTHGKAGFKD